MAIALSQTFLLRKLHQLSGIVPLGFFLFGHFFTNSKAMSGAQVFNDAVGDIHHIPYLLFVEIFGIFLPLMFHAVYGLIIATQSRSNVLNYGYGRNWFYTLQRVTGIFLFFFILFHILNFRFGMVPGLNETPVAGNSDLAFRIVSREFSINWVLALYLVGILATAWHLAYGFFLFAVDWGIVIGERAQRFVLYGCFGLALTLFAVGANAAVAFIRPCGLFPKAFCSELEEQRIVKPTDPRN